MAIPAALTQGLFPLGVAVVEASPAMWEGGLYAEERAAIGRAGDRRRRHFTAGRRCAREALAQLGIAGFPLLPGPDRRPRWPPGIVGSISHCEGAGAAAVAPAVAFAGIGIDVETTAPLGPRSLAALLHPDEREAIAALPPRERARAAKLIASAKECAYKALSGAPGCPPHFRALRVALDLAAPGAPWLRPARTRDGDEPSGTWSATIAEGDGRAMRLRGRFRCGRRHLATAAVRHPAR